MSSEPFARYYSWMKECDTMRVMFIEPQPCVRTLKIAKGLKWAMGENVSIVFGYLDKTLTEFYGHGDEFFDEFVKMSRETPGKSISNLVKKYKPHVIHSHNAPDYLTVSAINTVGDTPVIHDNHDVLTMGKTSYQDIEDEEKIKGYAINEKIANEQSDGRIYVSDGVRDYIRGRYKINTDIDLVFHNYINNDMIPNELSGKLSDEDGETHIVYSGTLNSTVEGHHYNLQDIFRKIADQGFHLHIYAAKSDEIYAKLADMNELIHYHGHFDQRLLLKEELKKYDYGWAGFNDAKNTQHLNVALPNKVFEYIACGLPVLTLPHTAIRNFIEKEKVGFIIDDFDMMKEKLTDIGEIPGNVVKKRYEYTIENNINQLIQFYKNLSVAD